MGAARSRRTAFLTLPAFRATLRWTSDRQRYHVEDIDAPDLATALEQLRARLPAEIGERADLLELRRQNPAEPPRE
jgi:hypothetical protein